MSSYFLQSCYHNNYYFWLTSSRQILLPSDRVRLAVFYAKLTSCRLWLQNVSNICENVELFLYVKDVCLSHRRTGQTSISEATLITFTCCHVVKVKYSVPISKLCTPQIKF